MDEPEPLGGFGQSGHSLASRDCFLAGEAGNLFSEMKVHIFTLILIGSVCLPNSKARPFEANWESMKAYECPDWFRDAKFGIFLHWGVNSVPGFDGHYGRHMYYQEKPDPVKGTGWTKGSRAVYDHHVKTYGHPSQFGYKDFIPMWKAEHFDPDELVGFFKSIGARYIVPVAVHHDNFDNWNSKHHRWNAVKMGPRRDLVGDWKKAADAHGLRFGVSSHFNGGHENVFFQGNADSSGPLKGIAYDTQDKDYEDFYYPRSHDRRKILSSYGEVFLKRHLDLIDSYDPDLLYFDGPLPYGENGLKVGAHFLNTRPGEVVLNLKRGFPPGAATKDIEKGQADALQELPWQTDTTINPGWFYLGGVKKAAVVDGDKSGREHKTLGGDDLRMDANQIIDNLVDIVSKNGNLLLNVGQRADGTIIPKYRAELEKVGKWLTRNGEAIFGTRPWVKYGEGPTEIETGYDTEPLDPWSAEDIRFTTKGKLFYVTALAKPEGKTLLVKSLSKDSQLGEIDSVRVLGSPNTLKWRQSSAGLSIDLPTLSDGDYAYVFELTVR